LSNFDGTRRTLKTNFQNVADPNEGSTKKSIPTARGLTTDPKR